MSKLHGNVILVDPVSTEVGMNPVFHQILEHWAESHGPARWAFKTHMPEDPMMVTLQACECTVDQSELDSHGFLWVGPYKAYLGAYVLIPSEEEIPMEEQDNSLVFNFPEELSKFFDALHLTDEERTKLMEMSLKDFLGYCVQAVQNLSKEVRGQEVLPEVLGISKRALLQGKKVQCPICHVSSLIVVDGQVKCPSCLEEFGDIDDLP